MKNNVLNRTKYTSENTDEWYTPYEIVAEEVEHYAEQFTGKVVYCNCDSPASNFCLYFVENFERLGLKKLVCTSLGEERGLLLTSDGVSVRIEQLEGNGDFRSEECVRYLKECDVCCTNPPFSLFSDLFSLLMKYSKQFLVVGSQNAISYKEVFPAFKEGRVWAGFRFGDFPFRVPQSTQPRSTRYWVDERGQKWRSLGNAMWFTNLSVKGKRPELVLSKKYSPEEFPKFDNFDAVCVGRVVDVPEDYMGIFGVPVTYLKYHNDEQFEIVGEANHGSDNEYDLFKPSVNGKLTFKKILIRRR